MKTIEVGRLSQDLTQLLAEVEAGEVFVVTRDNREIARFVPPDPMAVLLPRKRVGGSQLSGLVRRDLGTAASIDELLDDDRDR